MPLTDAELQGIAAQASNMAKRDLEQGSFNFLLAVYHGSDQIKLHRMSEVEALIIERLGKNWLNSGKTKDIGFQMMRLVADVLPPEAFVFVAVANGFSATAKLYELPKAQQTELLNGPHDRHHQAVKEGLLDVCDILIATVQTPERVCVYEQKLDRYGEPTGKPATRYFPQEKFGGRMKMFGSEHAVTQ